MDRAVHCVQLIADYANVACDGQRCLMGSVVYCDRKIGGSALCEV